MDDSPNPARENPFDKAADMLEDAGVIPPGGYNPAPVVERLNVWWLNGKDRYFQIRGEKPVLSLGEKDVKRELRLLGVSSKPIERREGDQVVHRETYSQADRVMTFIQRQRHVDFAGPLAGKKIGVYPVQGRRILVMSSFKLIEPSAGAWPILRQLLDNLLKTEEADQVPVFCAWLKVAIQSLRSGEARPGHGLILAGPSNCGKSFLQEHVITPMLGGRSADPTKYLLGKTQFNAEIGGAEHLQIQELPSGLDHKSRSLFAEEFKRLIATESHALHPKYCDAVTVFPWWRISLSINNNVDRLKALPPLSSDFGDKVLMLLCKQNAAPMPTETDDERRRYRDAIAAELSAFAAYLDELHIAEDLRRTKHAARFGHDHFHHPQLAAALFEQESESSLLYILDNFKDLYDEGVWGWAPSESLRETLTDKDACPRFYAQAREIFKFTGAAGTFLSKLSEKFPDRFIMKHSKLGNRWMIKEGP